MKNLKRALSLALATVMTMGMMAVGTGAVQADVSGEHNVTAIALMEAAGIMIGDDEGNFNPDAPVSRQEMAVVMCNMMGLNAEDYVNDCHFTDVADWAKGYVGACYKHGITSGISATEYGATDTITVAQAGLMMMKTLGYFEHEEEFEGDWKLGTVKNAVKIELFNGLTSSNPDAIMTRNDVAKLAQSTLESDLVVFSGSLGTNIKLADGTVVHTGFMSNYGYYNWTGVNAPDYDNTGARKQLIEKLYGDAIKKIDDGTVTDSMDRSGVSWEVLGEQIAFEADRADVVEVITTATSNGSPVTSVASYVEITR